MNVKKEKLEKSHIRIHLQSVRGSALSQRPHRAVPLLIRRLHLLIRLRHHHHHHLQVLLLQHALRIFTNKILG